MDIYFVGYPLCCSLLAALPRWLVEEYAAHMAIIPVRLGRHGLKKQIFLGLRESDDDVDYLQAFVDLARG